MSRRIVALNNNGVKSLACGDLREAILSFRHAIECLKVEIETKHGDRRSDPAESTSLENLSLVMTDLNCINGSFMLEITPHNIFDVFQYAFSFPKIESLERLQTEVSIVLFYNLALAHHLSGFAHAPHFDGHLREALRFYKLSLVLFRSSEDLNLDLGHFSLMVGLITNLGHIFSHKWAVEEALSCQSRLQELLYSGTAVGLTEDGGGLFLSALSHSAGCTCNLAPAA